MHLLTDDIYLDLTFTHFVSGGDFTYQRSTAPVPEPASAYLGLEFIAVVVGAFRWRRFGTNSFWRTVRFG